MKYPNTCIIVFAKEPVAGKVKTRLIPALGEQGAKELHIKLMHGLLTKLNQSDLCEVQLWVDANPQHPAFNLIASEHFVQQGTDLGERMHHASSQGLKRFDQIIIIGSDCPLMDESYLHKAIEKLTSVDVVIGPATDGGYVLIALKKPCYAIFENISWGTDKVLEQTHRQLHTNNISYDELTPLFDIDRPEDLKLL